jgi:hypothetical protein
MEHVQMSELKLDTRTPGIGPFFVGSYSIGSNIESPWEPGPGNTATLRSGTVTILVKIVDASKRKYSGEIVGFEGVAGETYEGFKEGDTINFTFEHTIGFSR